MFRTYVSWWRRKRHAPQILDLIVDPASDRDSYTPVDARLTLRLALRQLPPLQQAVLVGSYLRDHSDNEIAEMIGRSPVTVRSLRRRALKALSAAVGIDVSGDPTKEVSNGEPGVDFA